MSSSVHRSRLMPADHLSDFRPELALFIGLQATGKSTFFYQSLARTHLRLSLDVLRTRHRERVLFEACLASGTNVALDNTNPSREERTRYIGPARAAGFAVTGYFFRSRIAEALARNAARPEAERVPEVGVWAASARMELPHADEGFDRLYFVAMDEAGGFTVDPWQA